MKTPATASTLYGIVLVASGAIGAGMFSLPIAAAGMWYGWTIACLILVWLATLAATLLLLETNLQFKPGASFDTLVSQTLGNKWNFVNNLAIGFVLYILLYAYFSASGSIVQQLATGLLDLEQPPTQSLSSLAFGFLIALLVWLSASVVGRVCTIFLIGMAVTFLLSNTGLLLSLEMSNLFGSASNVSSKTSHISYVWAALPYFVTSFACAGIVPSLVKYFGHNVAKTKASLFWGTFISLVVYCLWITAVFGTLSRTDIAEVVTAGGNIGVLVGSLQSQMAALGKATNLQILINLFSNFAITTSFLSIGLGLFDYIADRFKFSDDAYGRTKSVILTFAPPALLSALFPNGFILAIGYAGLVVVFSFFIIPALMALKNRSLGTTAAYRVVGGNALIYVVLVFSVIVALCKILSIAKLLPLYP